LYIFWIYIRTWVLIGRKQRCYKQRYGKLLETFCIEFCRDNLTCRPYDIDAPVDPKRKRRIETQNGISVFVSALHHPPSLIISNDSEETLWILDVDGLHVTEELLLGVFLVVAPARDEHA